MKFKLYAALVLGAFLLSSCGGGAGPTKVNSKDDANEIISYTNNLIEYVNKVGGWMRTSERCINQSIESPRAGIKPSFLDTPSSFIYIESAKNSIETAPSALSSEDQAFFNTNVKSFKTTFEALRANLEALHLYYKNEDYKDDKYAKGRTLADSIETGYNTVKELRSQLMNKIDEVTQVAELIILEDHPLKDPILALKKDLVGFDSLYNYFSYLDEGTATKLQVDSVYKVVEQSVAANKVLYTDILNKAGEKAHYDSFYKNCDDALGTCRKTLRNVNDGKSLTESNFNSFNTDRNSLIGDYNRFAQ